MHGINAMSDKQQRDVDVAPHYQSVQVDDEINLLDLWRILVRQKKLICSSVLFFLLAAILYAFVIATPVYKAEVVISVPSLADVEELNQFLAYTPNKTLLATRNALVSKKIRRQFFEKMNLHQIWLENHGALSSDKLFVLFDKALTVTNELKQKKGGDEEKLGGFSVILEGRPVALVAETLSQFVEYAITAVKNQIVRDSASKIKNKRAHVTDHLNLVIKYAEKKRADKITRLLEKNTIAILELEKKITNLKQKAQTALQDRKRELTLALEIAVEMDIKIPIWRSSRNNGKHRKDSNIMINISDFPLYEQGSQWLKAELKNLASRNNDSFVPGLRNLQEQLRNLKKNNQVEVLRQRPNDEAFVDRIRDLQKELDQLDVHNINMENVSVVTIEQQAYVDERPVKPKKALIILLAGMLGLMLGVMAAFIRNAVQMRDI